MDPNAKDSLVARLKEATNVLVTVSNNPTVDQLAACIGFTLLLNKVGKRGAAVFSGDVPSTLEFLQPDNTIEKNTDSLRDFIIALDKSKADKLRYKVEDTVVKIFITPYRTSISDKDLDFSQGDFNVDVVLALGVHQKADLDQAIVAHGRILHDATVISVNNKDQGSLGTINWVDLQASSLSEMMALVGQELSHEAFDNQIATALMTGIVAETDRFSNEKTSPATMKLASELMGAGANQQLIANKLDAPLMATTVKKPSETDDGELTIEHEPEKPVEDEKPASPAVPEINLPEPNDADIALTIDEIESADSQPPKEADNGPAIDNVRPTTDEPPKPNTMTLEPPTLGGKLTANSVPEHLSLDPSTDPLSAGAPKTDDGSMLSRSSAASLSPLPEPAEPTNNTASYSADDKSLTDEDTSETHEEQIEDAREAVDEAIEVGGDPEKNLEPIQALGAQPVNLNLGHDPAATLPSEPGAQSPSDTSMPSVAPAVAQTTPSNNGVDPFNTSVAPSGDMSMPPNPTITPPSPVQPASSQTSTPAPNSDFGPSASQPFVNPSAPTPPSFSPAPSLPNVIDTGAPSAIPTNLVPPSSPKDVSGSSGPATPPPPVPPPMMPPMPSQQTPPAMNNLQPPLPPNQPL